MKKPQLKQTTMKFLISAVYFMAMCIMVSSSSDLLLHLNVRIRFLVTVNDTWDPNGCITTVSTPFVKYNESQQIQVGSCDHGPLVFVIESGSKDGYSKMQVTPTFYSSVIEDAVPPSCDIPWNGSYLNPTASNMELSPLPSCYTRESREGYHMTYYWFRLMEWQFD